ncbi:secondary thiamine-phosphate synthase enzyme YjbQ [Methylobacterium radiodurans]|uniref:Secondary thiamine-phosphate synthase enzyme n=1 Tax=Methylobacterium radiodurans TaxID=2202828 RepID=A0A2U8VPS1_9HYPH|nr:secondary thiamine-phosphate synthase enzyme YjbQ [Methylobacterium radiodurans]AWN35431.1 secondary thiamine-phosphate synthase enzyme [Methylobacterium radiodurans]
MRQGRIGGIEDFSAGEVRRQASARLTIATQGQGFTDVTEAVAAFVRQSGIRDGLVCVFCRHTSASLTIQENADPDVQTDLLSALDNLAPRGAGYVHGAEKPNALQSRTRYTHTAEGPDDMPAHIRTMLTDSSLSIPVSGGRLALGTWQGIYLIEHRDRPHRREIVLHVIGA